MPDVEVPCESCKGLRYNAETLEVIYKEKNILEILEMSIEEGVCFFKDLPPIGRKLAVLHELGLGYLTLGTIGDDAFRWRSATHQAGV
jgi:excinuclease ABC subunit A